MLLTTIENIGRPYTVYGMVRGSTIQCKNIGRDLMSGMRTLVGGEMGSYTEMMDEARDIATARMVEEAERLDADAVVGVRYTTSSVVQGAAEVLVYGTAVRLD